MAKNNHQLKLRNTKQEDYDAVREIMLQAYPGMEPWTKEQFASQVRTFPEGQICIEDKGVVVAIAVSLIVDYSKFGDDHQYYEITGNGYLTTHDPKGDTLYGVDLCVRPDYWGLRLGRRLYDARKELCENLNLRRIIIGGRIPGYDKYQKELSPQRYITEVRNKGVLDPVLTFQLANDFHIRQVSRNYLPEDKKSHTHAVIMEWRNIFYEKNEKLIGGRKSVVRVGVLQWLMRPVGSLERFLDQAEYFVDAVAGYNADFILFPELFNAPLLAEHNQENPAEAMKALSQSTEAIRERFQNFALSYNVNIIAGSMPLYEDEHLFNVSYLLRRNGSSECQYKLHITWDERHYWGFRGGSSLKVFDTDVGKIGVLICYDVEFPELSRLLAEQGIQILFVPYWTDTKSAYLRVRRCAQARAIENECYVAISGSVGNLPNVENMDMQYSQSAVFSPSDFAFPHDAVLSEATPNTEMPLIVDLDLSLLRELRMQGSVRNMHERRTDLYRVTLLDSHDSSQTETS